MSFITKKPFVGLIAFIIILFAMALGHTGMIMMENIFGHQYINIAAIILGFIGLVLLIFGVATAKKNKATFLGLFGGVLVWTGWIEFAYVYYANRFGIEPLMMDGEVVTKPEYLLLPSSIGFLAVFMIQYFFGSKTGCTFFNWFRQKLNIDKIYEYKAVPRNTATTTFMEVIILLWTFYLVLLFAYDDHFAGDRHILTYIIAYGSLFWSFYLFLKLLTIKSMDYAIKYAIPTVIIFWNFVEIMGRWNFFEEIWIEPNKYWVEMSIILFVFVVLTIVAILAKKTKNNQ